MTDSKLTKETKMIIEDLKEDLKEMLQMESNIEVVWRLEKLQEERAFQKSADYIRRLIEK